MRKWTVLITCIFFILAAATVMALQKRGAVVQTATNEVAPLVYDSTQPADCGNGSGCANIDGSSGCGGGCGTSADPAVAKERLESLKGYLYSYYSKKLGEGELNIEVEDFGCHQEATVAKNGTVVERLSISGNSIRRINS
jgi:hypothetical protein